MPTGIEEFLAAVTATLASVAGTTSAISGPLDPNGATEALIGASLATVALSSPDALEGDSGGAVPIVSSNEGGSHVAGSGANGDRPPPAQGYAPPMEEWELPEGAGVEEWYFDDPMIIEGRPRGAPPAGEAEDPADAGPVGEAGPPPAAPPPGGPESWVPADVADWWEQNVTSTPTALPFGMSGEQASDAAKGAVDDALTRAMDWIDPENDAARTALAVAATVAKLPAEVFVDMATGFLDPGSQIRGIMRTGTATPQGLRDIEQGNVAIGVSTIGGEVSGVVLTVVSPVKSVRAARIKMGGKLELHAEDFPSNEMRGSDQTAKGTRKNYVLERHASISITDAGGTRRSTHALGIPVKGNGKGPGRRAVIVAEVTDIMGDPKAGNVTASVNLPPEAISKAAARMTKALDSRYMKVQGGIGRYGINPANLAAESCATYAASIARAGGVVATGRLGTTVLYWMVRAQIPGWLPVGGAFGAVVHDQQANRSHPNRPR